jgi:uncharacterized membrane protein
MLFLFTLMIGMILVVSLYRRLTEVDHKHMNPALYWILFALGLFFVTAEVVAIFTQ